MMLIAALKHRPALLIRSFTGNIRQWRATANFCFDGGALIATCNQTSTPLQQDPVTVLF